MEPELVPIEQLLTVKDVATLLKVSRSAVYKWVEQERLACIRLGSLIRFAPEELRRFVATPGNAQLLSPGPKPID